jgi:hypothetical protein
MLFPHADEQEKAVDKMIQWQNDSGKLFSRLSRFSFQFA